MQNNAEKKFNLLFLRSLLQDSLVAALADENYAEANFLLAEHYKKFVNDDDSEPMENPAAAYILRLLLTADNFFSRRAAGDFLADMSFEEEELAAEIDILQDWVAAYQPPVWLQNIAGAGICPELADWAQMPPERVAMLLTQFYRQNGFGPLVLHHVWRWQGELQPVEQYDRIRLHDLVGYQSQKDEVMANTRLFVTEGRGNNLLLYGARGTGKSSLVKAVANELAPAGLCLVELPLEHMNSLSQLLALLAEQPRRYILFIDDLSFERADQSYKITKAVLEGSVSTMGGNVLIYATSNRRHLIVENWQDREGVQHEAGEVRASDSMSEKLSLADRFGQTVFFGLPKQQEYLRIVEALAEADGIDLPADELRRQALQWAMLQKHSGCSGRTARQFVNSLTATRL